MKTCPQCKLENPSAAKYCMACGAIFVEESPKLVDDVLFRKELDEVKEIIDQLKKSIAVIQESKDNDENDVEDLQLKQQIETLKQQIETNNKTIKELSGRIETQKNEVSNLTKQLEDERKKKKGGKWGWIFVLLCLVFAFGVYWYWDRYTYEKSKCDNYRENNAELKVIIDTLQRAYNALQNDYDTLSTDYAILSTKYPMSINKVEIASVYKNGSIGVYGKDISCCDFLKPRISYEGYVDKEIKLTIKWYRYSNNYITSHSESHIVHKGKQVLELDQQKGFNYERWPQGWYEIKIWCNGMMLASNEFYVDYY
jgi:hypothetical protein